MSSLFNRAYYPRFSPQGPQIFQGGVIANPDPSQGGGFDTQASAAPVVQRPVPGGPSDPVAPGLLGTGLQTLGGIQGASVQLGSRTPQEAAQQQQLQAQVAAAQNRTDIGDAALLGDAQSYITGQPVSSLQQAAYNEIQDPNYNLYRLNSAATNRARIGLAAQAQDTRYNIEGANQARGEQQSSLNLLDSAARGQGPSLANATLNSSLGSINNQLQAAAFAQQGNRGAGLTQRNLLNAQVAAGNNAQANAGVAAANEQTAARGQYASAANALRSTDIQGAQAQQYGDLARLGIAGQQVGAQEASNVGQLNANIAYSNSQQRNNFAQSALLANAASTSGQGNAALLGKIVDTGAGIAKYATSQSEDTGTATKSLLRSDINTKTVNSGIDPDTGFAATDPILAAYVASISPKAGQQPAAPAGPSFVDKLADAGIQVAAQYASSKSDRSAKDASAQGVGDAKTSDFLDSLQAYEYKYKNPERDGHGARLGIMAQDANKSEMGRNVVEGQEGSLSLDIPKAVSATLASVAHLNKRLDALEGRRNG